MKQETFCWSVMFFLSLGSTLLAQEPPNFPQPTEAHQWLKQFAGEWTTTSQAAMEPNQSPMECTGRMTSRMVGDFWVVSELSGDMGSMSFAGLQTIGYDPKKQKYVGTWVDSATDHLWHYEGTVDETGKKILLEAEGPNLMTDGQMTLFRDAYEFKTPDHIIATSSAQDENGNWVEFMTGDYRRVK